MNYILLFNEEQFEHLFQGDDEYKKYPYHLISDKFNFAPLLLKFEEYNSLLYEWYEDETKFDILLKLWKSDLSMYQLSKDSNPEIKRKLKEKANITMSEDDLIEFINIISSRTIETKASNIKNYLKLEEEYYVSLVQTINEYKEYFEGSEIDENKIISHNLDNISKKLIEESLPLIKDYINKTFPNLNSSAKRQLETKMRKKLREGIFNEIIHDKEAKKKGINFDVILTLSEVVNKAKIINKFAKVPAVGQVIDIANSFLNLATSIKTYYDEMYEYNEEEAKYVEDFSKIHEQFEKHKRELDLLDINDYEGSLKKIYLIGNKIDQDKKKCNTILQNLETAEQNAKKKDKNEKIAAIASTAATALFSLGSALFTGGLGAIIPLIAFGASAAACGVNVQRLLKLREQIKKYGETKKKEREYYKKICETINEGISKKKDEIRRAYINKYAPKNIDIYAIIIIIIYLNFIL